MHFEDLKDDEYRDIQQKLMDLDWRWFEQGASYPPEEVEVLIRFDNGKTRLAELRTEHPGFEDTFNSYQYWDDPENEGQDWEFNSVIGWKFYE